MLMNLFALALVSLVPAEPGDALTDADVTQLIRDLTPDANQRWRTIPWQLSLMNAQAEAAESKKPLFVWAMDGHPLGCT